MHNVVQVADQLAIGQVGFGVEDEPVQAILGEGEEEEAGEGSQQCEGEVEGVPAGNVIKQVAYHQRGQEGDSVPLVVREELDEISLKHAGRGHEQPMWRIDDFHVTLMIEIPYLRHEWLVGMDDT